MKFSMRSTAFAEAVASVSNALPRAAETPLLSGILIEPQIGALMLSAYDYERSISVTTGSDVFDTGESTLVSGRLLATVAKLLPSNREMVVNADDSSLLIECGKATFALPLMDAPQYPKLPDASDKLLGSVCADDLIGAVNTVVNFTSKDPQPVNRTAIHLDLSDEIELSATNGATAILTRVDFKATTPAVVDIPGALLVGSLAPWKGFDGDLTIHWDGRVVGLSAAGAVSTLRTLDVEFPAIHKVFPDRFASVCEVDSRELLAMLARASAFDTGDFSSVSLQATADALSARNSSPDGVAQDAIATSRFAGTTLKFTVNARRMETAIKAANAPTVTLGFTDAPVLKKVSVLPGAPEAAFGPGPVPPIPDRTAIAVMGMREPK